MRVLVAALLLALPATAGAQTGLYHSARVTAAGVADFTMAVAGELGSGWSVHPGAVDDFTDESGQPATLFGLRGQLVLIVGCTDKQLSGVAVGGLRGSGLPRSPPPLLFQDGNVDTRWGDEPIETQTWNVGREVLVSTATQADRFLDSASRESRLRVRATVLGNRAIQEEFDLGGLEITEGAVRIRGEGRSEMVCRR